MWIDSTSSSRGSIPVRPVFLNRPVFIYISKFRILGIYSSHVVNGNSMIRPSDWNEVSPGTIIRSCSNSFVGSSTAFIIAISTIICLNSDGNFGQLPVWARGLCLGAIVIILVASLALGCRLGYRTREDTTNCIHRMIELYVFAILPWIVTAYVLVFVISKNWAQL